MATEYVYKGREKEYKSEYSSNYYRENKDDISKRNCANEKLKRETDAEFRKQKIEYCREYYKNNKDKFKEQQKKTRHIKNARRRELYATNPEYRENMLKSAKEQAKKRPETRQKRELLQNYGITIEQYKEMLTNQNESCAICGNKSALINKAQRLHVDHCHTTGKVRGLLCSNCNQAIGKFKDSETLLKKALLYLQNSK